MLRSEAEHHWFGRSSRVTEGWFDQDARTVELAFPDGVRWHYYKIGRRTWEALKRAESPGRFLHDVLNRFPNGPAR